MSNALRTPRAHPEPVGQNGWKRDEWLVQDVMVGKRFGDGGDGGNGDDGGGNEDDDGGGGGNEDNDGGGNEDDGGNEDEDGGNEDDDGGNEDGGGEEDGCDDDGSDGNRLRTIYGNLHTPQSNCPQPKPTATYVLFSQQSWQHVLLSSMM